MKIKYIVFDIETTRFKNIGEESVGNSGSSPYHPDNKIILGGYYGWPVDKYKTSDRISHAPNEDVLVIGHNLAFDIEWMLTRSEHWRDWIKTGKIWDTMVAEHIITGQQSGFVSLNNLSAKYGGTQKPDKIKTYWDAGMDTDEIPMGELDEYLKSDLSNTHIVFLGQLEKALELDLLPLIYNVMESRLATIEMQYNGIHIDSTILKEQEDLVKLDISHVLSSCHDYITSVLPSDFIQPIDKMLNSPKILSALLFGGELETTIKQTMLSPSGEPVYYKSGKKKGEQRYTNITIKHTVHGMFDGDQCSTIGKAGYYKTGEDILKSIIKEYTLSKYRFRSPLFGQAIKFVGDVLKYRELSKDLNTYYEGYKKNLWPDNLIHTSFHHVKTQTGRLSSTNPNIQQVSS